MNYLIHPTAEVQTDQIGEGTSIWQYCVVLKDAIIGKNCNINFNVFIENDVTIGDNVTIKSGVQVWDGLRIRDNVFIGPNVTFINDNYPRSKNYPAKFLQTNIENGASIGAGSIILGGLTIGKNSMIGAGSILTKNVPANELWIGSPARFVKKIDVPKVKTVLLGSAGTGTAFASMLALRRNWGDSVSVIAIDSNPQHLVTNSLLTDKFIQVPLNKDADFKNILEAILINENVDTYIPFIDHEISLAAILYEKKYKENEFCLQVKKQEIAEICDDKYKTYLFLTENNILTPTCYLTHEPVNAKENLIIKPRKGFGSKIFKLLDNRENLSKFNPETYIIQKECEKPEITVDVCYDKNRDYFVYVCRERIETKSGVCTKARLFLDEKIEKIALTLAQKLDLSAFCFQLMKYNGDWAVTDINARLGAGTAISVAVGLDFFSGMFAILWGEDPSKYFKPLQKETFVTRQYSEFVMNL
jgi:UDP-2-acetamido-3-amino-2,3-dideoxy-glucuronate N-acetyltransferase